MTNYVDQAAIVYSDSDTRQAVLQQGWGFLCGCQVCTIYTLSTHYLHSIYTLSTQYLHIIYSLSTQYLHTHYLYTIYTLSTHYLLTIYTLSSNYLLTIYTLSTHYQHIRSAASPTPS